MIWIYIFILLAAIPIGVIVGLIIFRVSFLIHLKNQKEGK